MPARSIRPIEPFAGSGGVEMTMLAGLMPVGSLSLARTLTTTGVLMTAAAVSGLSTGAAAAGGGSGVAPGAAGPGGLEFVIVTIFISEPPRLDSTLTWNGGTRIPLTSAFRSAGTTTLNGWIFSTGLVVEPTVNMLDLAATVSVFRSGS